MARGRFTWQRQPVAENRRAELKPSASGGVDRSCAAGGAARNPLQE
jgi:hypothetical protein